MNQILHFAQDSDTSRGLRKYGPTAAESDRSTLPVVADPGS